jgi:hypothetical protein
MSAFLFQTDEFGLDDHAMHFLRNRFRYHSVPLATASVRIERGADIRNWQLMLLFGLTLLLFGLWYGWHVVAFLQSGEGGRIYIEQVVLPVFPSLLGLFALTMASRRGPVLILQEEIGKFRTVSLRPLEKNGRLARLVTFLAERAGQLQVQEAVLGGWQA